MKEINYKVLITTSGMGQRLGDITNYTNKALVRIGKKPAISYIIESYPKNVELVITLGYFKEHVKDFVELVYPNRKVRFVDVDKFQGKGSSLGYSMLKARNYLLCPFIYHACDTIVNESIPKPTDNWIGGYRSSNSTNYASYNVVKNKVKNINDKGAFDYDYLHIGLVGITDYKGYWDTLFKLYKTNPGNSSLNDSQAINMMLQNEAKFRSYEFNTWYDIGNTEVLNHARENVEDRFDNLDKVDEAIYLYDKSVVKFFYDEKKVKQKVKRARILDGLVPKVEGYKQNFYKYKYYRGELYSNVATPADFERFLKWSKRKLWKKRKEVGQKKFKKSCYDFYYNKTRQRVQKFLTDNKINDTEDIINNETVPSVSGLLKKIDFDWLSTSEQFQIHGDLILENIIKQSNSYKLIDWRENFGGLMKAGDMYYDLAKLNHNLTVNHEIVFSDQFIIDNSNTSIKCDILRRNSLVECQKILYDFICDEELDIDKVKILTPLVWLNMSPLHHYPFNIFLYYFGKWNLKRAIDEVEKTNNEKSNT